MLMVPNYVLTLKRSDHIRGALAVIAMGYPKATVTQHKLCAELDWTRNQVRYFLDALKGLGCEVKTSKGREGETEVYWPPERPHLNGEKVPILNGETNGENRLSLNINLLSDLRSKEDLILRERADSPLKSPLKSPEQTKARRALNVDTLEWPSELDSPLCRVRLQDFKKLSRTDAQLCLNGWKTLIDARKFNGEFARELWSKACAWGAQKKWHAPDAVWYWKRYQDEQYAHNGWPNGAAKTKGQAAVEHNLSLVSHYEETEQ